MIDDHNRCEWVNVSSGTSSPGLFRTKSSQRKTVVIVVVVVYEEGLCHSEKGLLQLEVLHSDAFSYSFRVSCRN